MMVKTQYSLPAPGASDPLCVEYHELIQRRPEQRGKGSVTDPKVPHWLYVTWIQVGWEGGVLGLVVVGDWTPTPHCGGEHML